MNTGRVIYGNLIKVYKGITDENGNPIPVLDGFGREIKKCNVESDPDYVAPNVNLQLCPTDRPFFTTTTFPITTTFNTTTTFPGSCNFEILSTNYNCSNPSFILVEAKTTISNGTVNVYITNNLSTIIRPNVTVINGSVFFSIPYSSAGNVIIEIAYGVCNRQSGLNIQCTNTFDALLMPVICMSQTTPTTSTSSTSTSSTSSTSTSSTTTLPVCTLNSISTSVVIPNQLRVDYNGHHITGFTCTVLLGSSVVEVVNVTSWSGNTFYINLTTPLCNGVYTVRVSPNECPTQFKTGTVEITNNICCTIDILGVTYISPTQTRIIFNSNGTSNVDWEIIQGLTSVEARTITVSNGENNIVINHVPLVNGSYKLKVSRGMSCFDEYDFVIATTTAIPCLFTLGTPIVTYNSSNFTYTFNIPITNSQPNYTVTIKYEGSPVISFNGQSDTPIILPLSLGGFIISGKTLVFEYLSETALCIKSVTINVP